VTGLLNQLLKNPGITLAGKSVADPTGLTAIRNLRLEHHRYFSDLAATIYKGPIKMNIQKLALVSLISLFAFQLPATAQQSTIGNGDEDTAAGEQALAAAIAPGDTLAQTVAKAVKANPALAGEIVEAAVDANTPRSVVQDIVNASYASLQAAGLPTSALGGVRAQLQAIANAELANAQASPDRAGIGITSNDQGDDSGNGYTSGGAANLAGSFPGGVSGGGSSAEFQTLNDTNDSLKRDEAESPIDRVAALIAALKAEKDVTTQLKMLGDFLDKNPELAGHVAAAAIKGNPKAAAAITAELVTRLPAKVEEIKLAAIQAAPGQAGAIELAADNAVSPANPSNENQNLVNPVSTVKIDITLQSIVSPSI
jgi:hypothetical protein